MVDFLRNLIGFGPRISEDKIAILKTKEFQ